MAASRGVSNNLLQNCRNPDALLSFGKQKSVVWKTEIALRIVGVALERTHNILLDSEGTHGAFSGIHPAK
jgi:hypothetical protein